MNRYESYRDTGFEWIGKIPKCWNCDRVGRTTYVKGRIGWKGLRSEDFIDEGPYLVTGTDFISGSIKWSNCYHVNHDRYEEDPFIILQNNDVLITKDGTIGKVAYVKELPGNSTLNSGIFVTRPLKGQYLQRYFYWVVSSSLFSEFVNFNSSGSTIRHLYQNIFERFNFPIPPLQEQKLISRYLDKKTKQIDSLVEKIQKKIELLKEQRTSLINQCVTKGLDPNVEMKDSGVEWIGEIPKHWDNYRLGVLGNFSKAKNITKGDLTVFGSPVILYGHIYTTYNRVTSKVEFSIPEELCKTSSKIKYGTFLFTSSGESVEEIGKTLLYLGKEEISVGGDMVIFTLIRTKGFDLNYLSFFLNSQFIQDQKSLTSRGEIIVHIYQKQLRELRIFLPPYNEQTKIKDVLVKNEKLTNVITEKYTAKIEKLTEYRQSLISSVVTGKVRVTEDMI